MDVASLIRQRLDEQGLDQKDLASAAQVTESYISQLLARKKAPPSPARTDIYEKIGQFLKLPADELSKLAEVQRQSELKKLFADPPAPFLGECRVVVLRKCAPARRADVRRIFEKESFGDIERLITQMILNVAQELAREERHSAEWLRLMAQFGGRSLEQIEVTILEFLDADVLCISPETCASFLDLMVDCWDIDLKTFGVEVVLNPTLAPGRLKRFEFVEIEHSHPSSTERGFELFLKDKALSGDITEDEVEFLAKLRFTGKRPTPLYYYRELQNLRDPLHFTDASHDL